MKRRLWFTLTLSLGLLAMLLVAEIGASQTASAAEVDWPARSLAATGGGPIGGTFTVTVDRLEEVYPAAAYNPDRGEYVVVWYNDLAGNDDIHIRAVSKNGSLSWGPVCVACGSGAERRYPGVAYDADAQEYLVVWEDQGDIAGQRIDAVGQLVGGEISIAPYTPPGEGKRPAVAHAAGNEYLVVWSFTSWGNKWHIGGVNVQSDGTVGNVFRI